MAKITLGELAEINEELAWVVTLGLRIDELGKGTAKVTLPFTPSQLRPGGTISGPSMMALADYAMYVAVLSMIGRVELAVTTNLSINFLRKPPPSDIQADCRLLKLGKRLAYGEVWIHSPEGHGEDPVAHATVTYSIPPN
ncbi:MAG: PaaI family thioesterase [Rhodovibrionaceae bacterium]